jgi:hypothetical protein
MSTAQDFISKSDQANLDKKNADSQVENDTKQLTDDQKAQADAVKAADDAQAVLTAVVSTVPDGILTDDGRYFEVVKGVLRQSSPVKASSVSGEVTQNADGSYAFSSADVPSPSPAPEPSPQPSPSPEPVPSPEPAPPVSESGRPDAPQSGFADLPPVAGGGQPTPTPGAEPVQAPPPPLPKSGFVA